MSNTDSDYPWRNLDDIIKAIDINNLQYINGVLRNTQIIHLINYQTITNHTKAAVLIYSVLIIIIFTVRI